MASKIFLTILIAAVLFSSLDSLSFEWVKRNTVNLDTGARAKRADPFGIECQVLANQSIISCDRGSVRCNVSTNFTGEGTDKYREFAISFVPNQESVDLPELIKFYLFPKMEGTYYQNFTVQIGFRFHRFSIYYAKNMFDDGFRIPDLKCYSKLVDLFRSKKPEKLIQTKTEPLGIQSVNVFGQLSLVYQ